MSEKAKGISLLFLIIFSIVQITVSVTGKNFWPISSYNMFNTTMKQEFRLFKAELVEDNGQSVFTDVFNLFPVEFFRINNMMVTVYFKNQDNDLKRNFSNFIIKNLNERKWMSFDEVYQSINPSDGSKFVDFKLHLWTYDFTQYNQKKKYEIIKKQEIYDN